MDRRVLFASLILLAGGATGVGVALFAFVGVDDATIDAEVVWESEPVAGDDGSGAVVATMDGDSLVIQSTVEDGNRTIRATAVGGGVEWKTAVGGSDTADDGTDPPATSGLVAGQLGGDEVVAFTTESGSLIVLNPADGTERLAVDLGGPGGLRPAIGDLDGDGDAEIAAVTTDGRVRAVDAAGETVFETDLDAPVNRRPLAVDFGGDANGSADDGADTARGLAVATAADGDRSISLLDATGEARWTTTPSVTPLSWSAADTRSGPVLALGGANGNLETIDVSDGGTRYEVGLQIYPSPSATQTPVASTSAGAAASGRSTCSTEKSSGNSSTAAIRG